MAKENACRRPSSIGGARPRPPKRVKIAAVDAPSDWPVSSKTGAEPKAEGTEEHILNQDVDLPPGSQLETVLPAVKTDEDAIKDYEGTGGRAWRRGQSSIYVDAFNLALDTVLSEERHLFTEAELKLFDEWHGLGYEAQYLYVRLFLRKTRKWFRIRDLHYYGDIADMDKPVQALQQVRALPLPPPGEPAAAEDSDLAETFCFAECSSQHINTLDEASGLLLLDELKALAKDAKVQGRNKKELVHNLCQASGQQTALSFASRLCPPADKSRDAHYTTRILEHTGRCIRLSLAPLRLFERVHLVFYRDTEWTEKSLTTLILAKTSRRTFPPYLVSRSSAIFPTRERLLEFEASLRTQFRVDSLLEFSGTPGKHEYGQVVDILDTVYPRWKVLLAEEQGKEERVYDSGEGAYLRRFNPAWVYTRVLHKCLQALARFKQHGREHELLTELLEQRLFHPARRGLWYQRKALLEEHYMHALTPEQGGGSSSSSSSNDEMRRRKQWKLVALRTCEQGLEDADCHIIHHYDLQRRIGKLERQLRVRVRERHDFGHVRLANAVERTIFGTRLERDEAKDKAAAAAAAAAARTVWLDELDTRDRVSVECMCLSHYRKELGWKGYHSEGGILRVLFGLLFYDILFTYVPNVFQTAYQTCPLDLHTDAFYPARISEINALINRISNGQAARIIGQVWDEHYEQKTSIVGVRWDAYELGDLLEIARCFPADALGTVMRVMAQEYAARGAGVPDLFLWRPPGPGGDGGGGGGGGGQVMFVEVKSANDRLSDSQRLWISVLLGAGITVELCHALAR